MSLSQKYDFLSKKRIVTTRGIKLLLSNNISIVIISLNNKKNISVI
jgi:hypothetical protein